MDQKLIILNQEDIQNICKRMSFQIWEYFIDDEEIDLFGIEGGGYNIALLLQSFLHEISNLKVNLHKLIIDKAKPLNSNFDINFDPNGKNILIVDDVANSGNTLMYALSPFIKSYPQKIKIAVLVDRKHKKFPVAPDIVGKKLSTTLQSHIEVNFNQSGLPEGAFLSN